MIQDDFLLLLSGLNWSLITDNRVLELSSSQWHCWSGCSGAAGSCGTRLEYTHIMSVCLLPRVLKCQLELCLWSMWLNREPGQNPRSVNINFLTYLYFSARMLFWFPDVGSWEQKRRDLGRAFLILGFAALLSALQYFYVLMRRLLSAFLYTKGEYMNKSLTSWTLFLMQWKIHSLVRLLVSTYHS